jgi:hypothetical protein
MKSLSGSAAVGSVRVKSGYRVIGRLCPLVIDIDGACSRCRKARNRPDAVCQGTIIVDFIVSKNPIFLSLASVVFRLYRIVFSTKNKSARLTPVPQHQTPGCFFVVIEGHSSCWLLWPSSLLSLSPLMVVSGLLLYRYNVGIQSVRLFRNACGGAKVYDRSRFDRSTI